MPFEIIRNDISKVEADVIVNTANPCLCIGPGVDEAIYKAAGKDELFRERKKIGVMSPGDVEETPAFGLSAKYVFHTVGPVWAGGNTGEERTLASCYRKSLEKAKSLGCESIAFPLISSGAYGFPKDRALKVAVSEISSFLLENEMKVTLVVYDGESFGLSGKLFDNIREYIKENEVKKQRRREAKRIPSTDPKCHILSAEYSFTPLNDLPSHEIEESYHISHYNLEGAAPDDLEEILRNKEESFQKHLFRLIDRKGLDDVDVYKRANIDRRLFSKIKSNENYSPSKRTAVAFAIALKLNLDETKDLLLSAGMGLSRSSDFDIIVEYCISHKCWDINEINCMLFEYGQPLLGA